MRAKRKIKRKIKRAEQRDREREECDEANPNETNTLQTQNVFQQKYCI